MIALREQVENPDLRAYARKLDAIARSVDRLEAEQVRGAMRMLADLRWRLLDALAAIPPQADGTYSATVRRALLDSVQAQMVAYGQRYSTFTLEGLERAWMAGAQAMPEAFEAAGLESFFTPDLSRAQIDVASQFTTDLIRNLTTQIRERITREITLAVLGGKPAFQVMQEIARVLRTVPGREGMGTFAYQAERIVRTEMNRAYSLANEARQQQVAATVPDMRKYWVDAEDARVRPAHAEAGSRYRPGGDPGPIPVKDAFSVGGERMRYPHDPLASAKNTIFCRCRVVLFHPEWDR